MNADHLFSLSALGGSLLGGPTLLTTAPHQFLTQIGSPAPAGVRVRSELLPPHHPPPVVVPTEDPHGITPTLAKLFTRLREARDANAHDLEKLTGGTITDPAYVRYAASDELLLALPMVARLPDRLGLHHWPKPLGQPHPDELVAPGPLRVLPDVEIHTAGTSLEALRNGRSAPLGNHPLTARILGRLTETPGATPAELAALAPACVLAETIAAWLVRLGVAGRAVPHAAHHRLWLTAGASPYGADQAIRHAPTLDIEGLPKNITDRLAAMRLPLERGAPTRIHILRNGCGQNTVPDLEAARRAGYTTVPVLRSHPGRLLIGPWLAPQGQPCPHCWHSTITEAASRPDLTLPFPNPAPDRLPDAIGRYIAKHLIGLDRRRFVFSLAVRTGAITKHPVMPDPACPHCGTAPPTTAPPSWGQPPVDVTTLPGLCDPVTGAAGTPHTPPVALTIAPELRTAFHVAFAAWTRRGMTPDHREFAAGKGRTREGARAGALAEALERRALSRLPSPARTRIREPGHRDITEPIVAANEVDLFGPEQRPGHADGTSTHPHNRRLPLPCPSDHRPLIQLRRLDGAPGPWIEAARAGGVDHAAAAAGCSNGVAAGPTLEHAIFRAFSELVERDATALWWYSMCQRPTIPLDALGTAREHARIAARGLRSVGRDLTLLDLATNRVLPTVAAVSFQGDSRPMLGLGASATHAIAATRAIAEIGQNLDFETGRNRLAGKGACRRAIDRLTRKTAPWLRPRGVERNLVNTPERASPLALLERASLALRVEPYWIDLTDPRWPLPVVRVIAPGLRHFWRRTAPGRLYTEPYHLGWTRRPLAFRDLNRLELLI